MVANNAPAPKIDTCRPYGRVAGMPGVAYTQDGAWYDVQGFLVCAPRAEPSANTSLPTATISKQTQQSVLAPEAAPQSSPAAERMRLSRQRRRDGMRVIPFEVRDSEIDGLVTNGLLDPVARNDRDAIARALGKLLDMLPPDRWPMAARCHANHSFSLY